MANEDHGPSTGVGRRLVFWDFARATWQYDVVVGLILIFIFATPREWFHDQPKASSVILMSAAHEANTFFIASDLLASLPPEERPQRAQSLIRARTGKKWKVARVQPVLDDSEPEAKGFIAYTTP